MSRFLLQGALNFDQVLYTVLTCATAGPALGFNRALVLLLDEGRQDLYGVTAMGPANAEDAMRIWRGIDDRDMSLEDLIAEYEYFSRQELSPLQRMVKALRFPVASEVWPAVSEVMRTQVALRDTNPPAAPFPPCSSEAPSVPRECAVAPLVAKEGVIGVVVADNVYNGRPISPEDVQLLATLAHLAGLALANAQAYSALKHAQQELVRVEKMAAVGEMAARVSHEIRNPLVTIGGFAHSLLRAPHDVERVRRNSQIIADEVQRLEELLTDMLDLARPSALVLRPEQLPNLLDQAWLLTSGEVQRDAPVELRKKYDPALPEVYVDARSLLRAFLNVLRNAVQAMPEGGTLSLTTRHLGSQALVAIADTGGGIPRHVLPTIFTPFSSHRVRGTGLGLSITQQIIAEHGGHIAVDTVEGKGTIFTFSLPLKPQGAMSERGTL
jgi:signal transduction histidine kinase